MSGQWLGISGGVSFVKDAISQTQFTDNLGRRTYQYINVNGNYRGQVYVSGNQKLKHGNSKIGLSGETRIDRNINYVNGAEKTSNNNVYTAAITFNKQWLKEKDEIAGVEIRPGITYNDNQSNISTFATSYWSTNISADIHVDLPWKLKFSTTVRADFRQRTTEFDRNNHVICWNAFLGRKLLKGDVMEFRVSVFDIFDQNRGYTRTAQNNNISENNYNTIRRYGMVSLIWNFSSPGGKQD